MFRFEYGYLHHILFFTLQTFPKVHRSIFRSCIYFSHLMKHVFVDETCHNHESVLFYIACSYTFSTRYLLFFFVSLDVEQAVSMSPVFQALWERRRTEDAHEKA